MSEAENPTPVYLIDAPEPRLRATSQLFEPGRSIGGSDDATPQRSAVASLRARLHGTLVYRPLAFAEPAESIELAKRGLRVRSGDTVAGITSSADILLSLLADGPARIYGFDANPTQTALARLKHALCAGEELERAMGLLGLKSESRTERLQMWTNVRPRLSDDAAILEKYDIGRGLLNCGATRMLFRLMSLGLRLCLGRENRDWLMGPTSTALERLKLVDDMRRRAPYRCAIRPVLRMGRRLFQNFFYPPALCRNSDHPRRALSDILASYSRLFEVGFWENPVFDRFLTGRIPREQVRCLYSPESWSVLKSRSADIGFETAPIQKALRQLGPRSVDAFYLSNAPDYLRPEGLHALSEALTHAGRPGARVFYLSLEPNCPFSRIGVPEGFCRETEIEQSLLKADPVGLYQYIGVLLRE